jgi:hypothetical protein
MMTRHFLSRDKLVGVCDRRDRQKKKFIETLEAQSTVLHACKAAGISRQTAYRWQHNDLEFAAQWDQALENAVDVVENSLYQKAVSGDTICMIFYLKAHRPIYRDRLNVDVEQVNSEIQQHLERLRANPALLGIKPVLEITE